MQIKSINPFNGKTIETYKSHSLKVTQDIIAKMHKSYLDWKRGSFKERAALLKKVAIVLRDEKEECARLMAMEMGKPVTQGRSEIEKCARVCEYFAENAEDFLKPEQVPTDATKSYISFQPIGIVLAIMPWNFPFWQVFRNAAPNFMAGNTVVLKHALNVPGCALKIESIFQKAGYPADIFRSLLIEHKHIPAIIQNPYIRAVSLTGSTEAGRSVAMEAGNALKKCVLELGGSDPYIILKDADLDLAAKVCAEARLLNSGQSCVAPKRFIVIKDVKKKFEEKFKEEISRFKVGDPLDESTNIGPLARFDLRDTLSSQVKRSISSGAKCILGGEIPKSEGAFYPPTVLTDVPLTSPAANEELFGPVASVITAKDSEEGITIANSTLYGLGAAVFTKDVTNGEKIANTELDSGLCFVNANVHSAPNLPFGGVKESGYGRELSQYGIKEFVNIKTVYVK